MPKDALMRRRGRRPARFCQEQTLVLTEQLSSMDCDASHGQSVKTVAYLRVSTAQ